MFHSSFSLLTVDINKCINHSLKIFWSVHFYYFIFDSVFEFSIVLWCKSFVISLCKCCNSLKLCWVLNHWFILLQNINMLFCCSFLVDYLKNLFKFLFELSVVIKYQFFVFISFLTILSRNSCSLKSIQLKTAFLSKNTV